MHNIWFTSDLHIYHKNIINIGRQRFDSIEQMNEEMLLNWNKCVRPEDEVYLLGDVSFTNATRTAEFLNKLHGKIYLIRGNHDSDILKTPCIERFEWVKDIYYLKIQDPEGPDGKHQHIVLCHYPILSWQNIHYGSWMLHGHCHGTLGVDTTKKRHDVGVDNNFFKPVSYERLKQIMSTRIFKPVDHHIPKQENGYNV